MIQDLTPPFPAVQYLEINRGPYAQEMEKAFESASAAVDYGGLMNAGQ